MRAIWPGTALRDLVRAQVRYVATLQRGVTVLGRLVALEEGMEEGIV
jgi:hypothetical protein